MIKTRKEVTLKTSEKELKFLKYYTGLAVTSILSSMVFGAAGIVFLRIIEHIVIGWTLLFLSVLLLTSFIIVISIGIKISEKIQKDYKTAVDNNDSGVIEILAPLIASIGLDSDGSPSDSSSGGGDAGGGDD